MNAFQRSFLGLKGRYFMIFSMILMIGLFDNCLAKESHTPSPSVPSRQVQIKEYRDTEGKLVWTKSFYIDPSGREVLHGPQILWYSSGTKSRQTQWVDGEFHGLQIEWSFINGEKTLEGRWEHDKRVGKWTEWHAPGKKESECTYNKEGLIEGTKRYWDDEGTLVREDRYDGHSYLLEITVWHNKKQKKVHGTFRKPAEDQIWQGPLFAGVVEKHPKDGSWTYWDINGKVIAQGTWKNGKPWNGICGKPTHKYSSNFDIYSLEVGQYKDGKLIKELKLVRKPTNTKTYDAPNEEASQQKSKKNSPLPSYGDSPLPPREEPSYNYREAYEKSKPVKQ